MISSTGTSGFIEQQPNDSGSAVIEEFVGGADTGPDSVSGEDWIRGDLSPETLVCDADGPCLVAIGEIRGEAAFERLRTIT